MEASTFSQKDRERIGERIRNVRESKGMSREELASLMGGDCTEETVRQYEDGVVLMDVNTLFSMTRALGVTPNDIAPGDAMASAASGLGDYARLSGKNRRMVDQVIGIFLRDQRADGIG